MDSQGGGAGAANNSSDFVRKLYKYVDFEASIIQSFLD